MSQLDALIQTFPTIPNLGISKDLSDVLLWHNTIHGIATQLIFDITIENGNLAHHGWSTTTADWQLVLNAEHDDPDTPAPVANHNDRRAPPSVLQLAANPSAASLEQNKRSIERRQTYSNMLAIFTNLVRNSLGENISRRIAPDNNFTGISVSFIINEVINRYGRLSAVQLSTINATIANFKFSTSAAFAAESTTLTKMFTNLAAGAQPIAPGQQIDVISRAAEGNPEITTAIRIYRTNNPTLAQQNPAALLQFIDDQLTNNPMASAHSYGYAAPDYRHEAAAAIVSNNNPRPHPPPAAQALPAKKGSCPYHPLSSHHLLDCLYFRRCFAAAPDTTTNVFINLARTTFPPAPPSKYPKR